MLRFEKLPKVNSERWLSLDDIEGEEWRDVIGFEDRYAISNYGRLKRKSFFIYNSKTGYNVPRKDIIIKNSKNLKGYYICRQKLKDRKLYASIHRLVALAFIDNPNNYPVVNHKDENKENNCVYNLEWCTYKHNTNYGTNKKRIMQTKKEKGLIFPVVLYSYEGDVIEEFDSSVEAAKKYGLSGTDVIRCCRNERTSIRGLHFRFKNDTYIKRDLKKDSFIITVENKNKYLSVLSFCKEVGISSAIFFKLLKGDTKCIKKLNNLHIKVKSMKYNCEINNGVIIT